MRVLLVGGGGFLGRAVQASLQQRGHTALLRRAPWQQAEQPEAWRSLLDGVDAAIYLAGTVRDESQGSKGWLERLHHHAPKALAQAGVLKLVHVSALCGGSSGYARSKQAGDAALLALNHPALHVVQPSLAFGPGGITSRQLRLLSQLPAWPLPRVMQTCRLQPLRVEDLAEALVRLLDVDPAAQPLVAAGPEIDTLPGWLARHRAAHGLPPGRLLTLPDALARWSARLGNHVALTSWNEQTLALLGHNSVAEDPAQTAWLPALLGRPLRGALEGPW